MKKQFRIKHAPKATGGYVDKTYIRRKPQPPQPSARELLAREREAAKRKAKR